MIGRRNFARGEPPPSDSWEWIGLAKPPSQKEVEAAKKVEAARAKTPAGKGQPVVMTATESITMIDIRPKQRIWPWALASGIVGFLWGKHGR